MEIILSNSSSKPIYEQIVIQIKELIMQGKLKPNDPLPSMRLSLIHIYSSPMILRLASGSVTPFNLL